MLRIYYGHLNPNSSGRRLRGTRLSTVASSLVLCHWWHQFLTSPDEKFTFIECRGRAAFSKVVPGIWRTYFFIIQLFNRQLFQLGIFQEYCDCYIMRTNDRGTQFYNFMVSMTNVKLISLYFIVSFSKYTIHHIL